MSTTEQAFYETKEFQKLEKEWYDKLKADGFVDIEYRVAGKPGEFLVGPNPEYFLRRYSPDKERYYELARQWLWYLRAKRPNPGKMVKRVWALHTEGKSIADICQATEYTRGQVARVVRQQKDRMLEAVREMRAPFRPDDYE